MVPSLWAPFHHRPAVATLVAFTGTAQPDGIVFMNAPGDPSTLEERDAFMNVLAAFRAIYPGPIAAHGPTEQHAAVFARLNVATLHESAAIVPGWRAASIDVNGEPDMTAHAAATAGVNVVYGATGRLRLTGRAVPRSDGTMRAWLVFECGTLAADPDAGTLGFGILEIGGATVTARPIRIGADGSFTYRGVRHKPP